MKSVLKIFKVYEWIFLFIAYATIITFSVLYKSEVLEIISVLVGMMAVMLNMGRKKYCFFFYATYATIYGISSFINKQYGEAILSVLYNLPVYLYTLFNFYIRKKSDTKDSEFKINHISKFEIILIVIFIPVITAGYGFLLKYIGSNQPFFNALASSLAIVSCYLASKTIREQWIFWILYSVVLVYIWCENYLSTGQAGLLYLILNAFYIIVNIYGYVTWIIYEKNQKLYQKMN